MEMANNHIILFIVSFLSKKRGEGTDTVFHRVNQFPSTRISISVSCKTVATSRKNEFLGFRCIPESRSPAFVSRHYVFPREEEREEEEMGEGKGWDPIIRNFHNSRTTGPSLPSIPPVNFENLYSAVPLFILPAADTRRRIIRWWHGLNVPTSTNSRRRIEFESIYPPSSIPFRLPLRSNLCRRLFTVYPKQ